MSRSISLNELSGLERKFAERADTLQPKNRPGYGDGQLDRNETRQAQNSIRLELKDRLHLDSLPDDTLLTRGSYGSRQALPPDAVEHRFGKQERELAKMVFVGQDLDEQLAPLSERVADRFGDLKAWWDGINPFNTRV